MDSIDRPVSLTWAFLWGTGKRGEGRGERGEGRGNREQGTGNREQGIGNREQGTGNREQGTGNRAIVAIGPELFTLIREKAHVVIFDSTLR
ncbi:MAG: hypothetical protein EYR95_18260 [Phormidium sp. SL48-SHIP]|nr:MAG: hypothetical protein EYR95_18260 [Phormidium sp. SL48-SHIP]